METVKEMFRWIAHWFGQGVKLWLFAFVSFIVAGLAIVIPAQLIELITPETSKLPDSEMSNFELILGLICFVFFLTIGARIFYALHKTNEIAPPNPPSSLRKRLFSSESICDSNTDADASDKKS